MVAEDNLVLSRQLHKYLTKCGHDVWSTENGLKAWDLFNAMDMDMIITDWMMPELDGLDLCKKIRSSGHSKYTYIIVLTARDRKKDLIDMLEAGADDYITKPFDPEELRVRIQTGQRILELENKHTELVNVLMESRNKLRTVFDALNEEIIAIDDEFRIISMNNAFLKNEGLSYKEFAHTPYYQEKIESLHLFKPGKVMKLAKDVFQTGISQRVIESDENRHGSKIYREIQFLPVKDKNGKTFQVIIVSKDITDEKRKSKEIESLNGQLQEAIHQINTKNDKLEQALNRLRQSQAQILQSEKMSSIGQLAAGIAHEINNPTGYVSSNLKTLSDYQEDMKKMLFLFQGLYQDLIKCFQEVEIKDDSLRQVIEHLKWIQNEYDQMDMDYILQDATDLIKESREGIERIKKIIIDLKDFAHPGADELQLTDINRNIDSTLNIVWNEIKYKAIVEKDYGVLPQVRCYPQQLNQVFMNVLMNAAQAIEEKGVINVSTHADNGHVWIKISDTGKGISKENIPKIFDPFFTTKEIGKGTGLGMNVAYNIIKKHDGTIDVNSDVGKGSTFTIRIPIDQVKMNS